MRNPALLLLLIVANITFASALERYRVVILPLDNRGDAKDAWFSRGLQRAICDDLAIVSSIDVIPYDEVREAEAIFSSYTERYAYRDRAKRIAALFGANVVIQGAYTIDGMGITIDLKAVKAEGWSRAYGYALQEGYLGRVTDTLDDALIELLTNMGGEEHALLSEDTKEAIRVAPLSLQVLRAYAEGDVYAEAGDRSNALERYTTAYSLATNVVDVGCALGTYALAVGDASNAAHRFSNALDDAHKRYGETNAKTALLHFQIGNAYRMAGDDERAVYHLEEARFQQERMGLIDTLSHARTRQALAGAYELRADMRSALQHYQKAKAYYEERRLLSLIPYARVTTAIARAFDRIDYRDISQMDLGFAYYETARHLYERMNLTNSQEYAHLLTLTGAVYARKGEKQDALARYTAAETLFRQTKSEQSEEYAFLLNSKGRLARAYEQPNAERYYENAKTLYETLERTKTSAYASVLENIAYHALTVGQETRGKTILSNASRIYHEGGYTNTLEYAGFLVNQGALAVREGAYDEANAYYLRANTFYTKRFLVATEQYAHLLQNMAHLYAQRGRYDEALALYEGTQRENAGTSNMNANDIYITLSLTKTIPYATLLEKRGIAHAMKGYFEKAETLFTNADAIYKERGMQTSIAYAGLLESMGVLASLTLDHAKAAQHFTRAKSIYVMKGQAETHFHAGVLINLGAATEETGNTQLAKTYYESGRAIYERNGMTNRQGYVDSIRNSALLLMHEGKTNEALPLLTNAMKRYRALGYTADADLLAPFFPKPVVTNVAVSNTNAIDDAATNAHVTNTPPPSGDDESR